MGQPAPAPAASSLLVPARALLVGRNDTGFQRLASALRDRGIAPYLKDPAAEDVFSILKVDPRISVLGVRVNELHIARQEQLLRLIFDQPGLKTFSMGSSDRISDQLRRLGVSQFSAVATDAEAIADEMVIALSEHEFDTEVVRAVAEALPNALSDAKVVVEAMAPVLRISAIALGEM